MASLVYKLGTTLYVAGRSAQADGVAPIVNQLRAAGWTVVLADIRPTDEGFLAKHHPAEFWIVRDKANEDDARAALRQAIIVTGNYSIVSAITVALVGLASSVSNPLGVGGLIPRWLVVLGGLAVGAYLVQTATKAKQAFG